MGVNNDLFSNAKSIKRIIGPSKNAFNVINEIKYKTEEYARPEDLILIALGPTATILAYELAKDGFQAIDIGHIDIEYEWYLRNANSKIPIPGKYVNEASDKGGNKPDDSIINDEYLSQIICTIVETNYEKSNIN